MKRFVSMLLVSLLLMSIIPVVAVAHTAEVPYSTDLVQGRKHVDFGDVKVWNDADTLYVKYVVTKPGWYLGETHVEVKTSWTQIPQSRGNAVPGLFSYKMEHEFITEYTYEIPITWPVGTTVAVAAHGCACGQGGDVADICDSLPPTVTEELYRTGDLSYFETLVSGGTSLDGSYLGWCVNPLFRLWSGFVGTADVFCSYQPETMPVGVVDHPENLDLVNWLLNQDYIAQGYRFGEVQVAIWQLLSDNPDAGSGQGIVDPAKIAILVAEAMANGEGFVPAGNQYVGIILLPKDSNGGWLQPNLILKQVPVYETGCESVWAEGEDFPGNDWSMYFHYTIQ